MELSSLKSKVEFGTEIEQKASAWLEKKSWKLVARNYRCRVGEIDLIYEKLHGEGESELIFVEVRARQEGGSWIGALESVDWKKQQRLKRAIRYFLARYRGPATSLRVDILGWDGLRWAHWPNVWIA